jgi:hypothetical protein
MASSAGSSTPSDKDTLIKLAETYAEFLRTKLSPHLRDLVAERDELDRKRRMMVSLCDDVAAIESDPSASFPPIEGSSADDSVSETYTTPCSVAAFMSSDPAALPLTPDGNELRMGDGQVMPVSSMIEVTPVTTSVADCGKATTTSSGAGSGDSGMYVECGLNFFVQCVTPLETTTLAENRIDFLTDCIDRVQVDVEKVSDDIKVVIKNLEDIGGEIKEDE